MFSEMMGDLNAMIRNIGLAVVFSLLCVAGNSMAMALRERTTEVAVPQGRSGSASRWSCSSSWPRPRWSPDSAASVGALGCKLLCDVVDVARYSGGFLAFFYISWPTAHPGAGVVTLCIGFLSGFIPAVRAAQLSVVGGLRKVV